jgi:hypothetical protein
MEKNKKLTSILNLFGELPAELRDYFSQKNIPVTSDAESCKDITHIITGENQNFSEIAFKYETIKNEIDLISISSIDDFKDFQYSNGKLVLNPEWLKSPISTFILDKVFKTTESSSNQFEFQEKGHFNIVNPFSLGENLDRLVHHAFEDGIDGLPIKIFFDHFTMHLAGLKTLGKIGMPVEVNYGGLEGIFAIQFAMSTEDLNFSDLTTSFSKKIHRRIEENVLNFALHSIDFFEVMLLSDVKKAFVTCLWSKNKFSGNSVLLNEYLKNDDIPILPFNQNQCSPTEIIDHSEKIHLPQAEFNQKIDGDSFTDSLVQKIVDDVSVEQVKKIIGQKEENDSFERVGGEIPVERDESTRVKGVKDPTEQLSKISSDAEIEESVQRILGKIEEDKTSLRIPETKKVDTEQFVMKVSSALCENFDDQNMRIKIQGYQQYKLKEEIQKFATERGKDFESLSDDELKVFNQGAIPAVIRATEACQQKMLSFKTQMKQVLIEGLTLEYSAADQEELIQSIESGDFNKIKNILKDSLKKNIDSKFEFAFKNQITPHEKESLVRIVSASVEIPEEKLRDIVQQETARHSVNVSSPEIQKEKFDKAFKENLFLKQKIVVLMNELKVLKHTKKQVEQIDQKINPVVPQFESILNESVSVRQAILQSIPDNPEGITPEDAKRLGVVLEKEAKIIEGLKAEEIQSKKMIIEMNQKQNLFEQQIEQLNRQVRAKDLIITKTKESFSNLVDKKNNELVVLKERISLLNQQLNNGEIRAQLNQVKVLENQNSNLVKMIEIYKSKITELSNLLQKANSRTDESASREEERKNQILVNQFKHQLEATTKELNFLQEKHDEATTSLISLRNEKTKLEQQLKKVTLEASKKEENKQTNTSEALVKKLEGQITALENQLKEAVAKSKDLEHKLQSSQNAKKQDPALDEPNKKLAQLEASVKKLNQDLIESRNLQAELKKEAIKFKSEKTGLQNQINALIKELDKEKEKSASHKKSDGKAA